MRLWLGSTRGFRRFTRGSDVPRLRRSACCGPRCCSFSIRSARSGSWSNGWSSTCCFAGSSGLRSTRRCSTPRPSRRTATACSRTRSRRSFCLRFIGLPEVKGLLSGEHFSVDGTLLKAWASMKSFRPKSASGEGAGNGPSEPPPPGRNREADFRKTKRSNKTHASTTDKDARLYRKGAGRRAVFAISAMRLMENRNGLVAAAEATLATGTAEREAAAAFEPALAQGADPRRRQGL